MKLTKYAHACFTLEKDDQVLVVDPGNFSKDFTAPHGVVAVIITHEHADHIDPAAMTEIRDKNPNALLIATKSVIDSLPDYTAQVAVPGDTLHAGGFDVEIFGGKHAVIHPSMPVVDNVAIMIDGTIYYPGDSFTPPERPVDVLALPVAAPWSKISEVIDFITQVQPRFAFPTHDAILSSDGQSVTDSMIGPVATTYGGEYRRLEQPLDI